MTSDPNKIMIIITAQSPQLQQHGTKCVANRSETSLEALTRAYLIKIIIVIHDTSYRCRKKKKKQQQRVIRHSSIGAHHVFVDKYSTAAKNAVRSFFFSSDVDS